jgi:hypothetical protein
MADTNAAIAATAAHLDCVANSVTKLCPLKWAASPSLRATTSASPLEMNAETKAIQNAELLFIALPKRSFGFCDKQLGRLEVLSPQLRLPDYRQPQPLLAAENSVPLQMQPAVLKGAFLYRSIFTLIECIRTADPCAKNL